MILDIRAAFNTTDKLALWHYLLKKIEQIETTQNMDHMWAWFAKEQYTQLSKV